MILRVLHRFGVQSVLSATPRLLRTASLHFVRRSQWNGKRIDV